MKKMVKPTIHLIPGLEFEKNPENLGTNINTKHIEILPVISPDGKTLYFTRKGDENNIGSPLNDIWVSTQNSEGKWTKAKNLGEPLNNKDVNGVLSVTPDGNSLLLVNVYTAKGMLPGLSISSKTENGWAFPTKVEIEDYYNLSNEETHFLSNSGNVLISAYNRKEGKGGLDLYMSTRMPNGKWSKPKNLGKTVNTAANEQTPFLASDNKTLFFSTEGFPGYGRNDIFMTKRLDDTWKNWSEPKNLGNVINSERADGYFTIPASGNYGYMISGKNSIGAADIFKVSLPLKLRPEPVVLISGKVFDANTNRPLKAEIIYKILPSGKEVGHANSDPKTGEYKIVLPPGFKYGFLAKSQGYIAVEQNIDIKGIERYIEIDQNLELVPIKKGEIVRLNNIFFETGDSILLKESYPELNRVVHFLENNTEIEIEIEGHTDNVGDEAANLSLSEARAKNVWSYIISHGIPSQRIAYKGLGESKPVASNDTDDGKAQNRRVEFTILKVD